MQIKAFPQTIPAVCQTSKTGDHDDFHLASALGELQHSHCLRLVLEEGKLPLPLVVSQSPAANIFFRDKDGNSAHTQQEAGKDNHQKKKKALRIT